MEDLTKGFAGERGRSRLGMAQAPCRRHAVGMSGKTFSLRILDRGVGAPLQGRGWTACEPRLIAYCGALGMPHTAAAFIARLKDQLTEIAGAVDAGFPANAELTLDADGNPHLKQQQTRSPPEGLVAFEVEV